MCKQLRCPRIVIRNSCLSYSGAEEGAREGGTRQLPQEVEKGSSGSALSFPAGNSSVTCGPRISN